MDLYNKKKFHQFFETRPIKCSYLDGRDEKRLVLSLKYQSDANLLNKLTTLGFRRNLDYMYLPICNSCSSCISSRIVVKDFKNSKSQKRNLKKNSHFELVEMIPNAESRRYEIFKDYINARHHDSQMQNMKKEEFKRFLYNTPVESKIFDLIDESKNIIASILLDQLEDGMSAVYSFYKPQFLRNGLGIFLILKAIEQVKIEKKKFLYLGYWVKNSKKMDYKVKFNNLQIFIDGNWKFIDQKTQFS